jgi:ribulose-bisphosphate carboxylase large chain
MPDRIQATYWVETAFPLQQAAEVLAGEQSSGTFISLPGETPELKARSGAVVERIEELDVVNAPSLPGAGVPKGESSPRWKRANVRIAWPLANLGPSLPNLQAAVAGNLFELKQFSGLRLLSLSLPEAFRDAYPGPQFGVAGTRKLAGVERLPLIGTIVKPSVGLSPEDTAAMVRQLADGGLDFIKDDELQADGPHCPFAERVDKVMRVLRAHAGKTGKMVMFAFNLTGEIDEMRRRHDLVLQAGGTCVMASIHSIGLTGMTALRSHSQLPIHAHRNGWGIYGRSPHIGVDYRAWQKFWRLAGADHMHVNGIRNKFCEGDESVIASAKECLTPMFEGPGRGCEVMPVFSSGQWADQAFETYAALGSSDLIHAAGGGIMGHPDGIAAGAASMRAAWDGALAGLTREQVAAASPEFRRAREQFGK